MLTREAFNALLKTLEEPPPHVVFIFATTETQKIPATILSRCQCYDFRRISVRQIADNLQKIAQAEGIRITDRGLAWIAAAGDGSMRDAQSIFDQAISYAGSEIQDHDLEELLGLTDRQFLFSLSEAILERNAGKCLKIIEEGYYAGLDMKHFYETLLGHFRNLLLTKIVGEDQSFLDVADDRRRPTTGDTRVCRPGTGSTSIRAGTSSRPRPMGHAVLSTTPPDRQTGNTRRSSRHFPSPRTGENSGMSMTGACGQPHRTPETPACRGDTGSTSIPTGTSGRRRVNKTDRPLITRPDPLTENTIRTKRPSSSPRIRISLEISTSGATARPLRMAATRVSLRDTGSTPIRIGTSGKRARTKRPPTKRRPRLTGSTTRSSRHSMSPVTGAGTVITMSTDIPIKGNTRATRTSRPATGSMRTRTGISGKTRARQEPTRKGPRSAVSIESS